MQLFPLISKQLLKTGVDKSRASNMQGDYIFWRWLLILSTELFNFHVLHKNDYHSIATEYKAADNYDFH